MDDDPVPQAFSHFSWHASKGMFLICDIQGWGHVLTDPQIHTIDGKGFGAGNLGVDGIGAFLKWPCLNTHQMRRLLMMKIQQKPWSWAVLMCTSSVCTSVRALTIH